MFRRKKSRPVSWAPKVPDGEIPGISGNVRPLSAIFSQEADEDEPLHEEKMLKTATLPRGAGRIPAPLPLYTKPPPVPTPPVTPPVPPPNTEDSGGHGFRNIPSPQPFLETTIADSDVSYSKVEFKSFCGNQKSKDLQKSKSDSLKFEDSLQSTILPQFIHSDSRGIHSESRRSSDYPPVAVVNPTQSRTSTPTHTLNTQSDFSKTEPSENIQELKETDISNVNMQELKETGVQNVNIQELKEVDILTSVPSESLAMKTFGKTVSVDDSKDITEDRKLSRPPLPQRSSSLFDIPPRGDMENSGVENSSVENADMENGDSSTESDCSSVVGMLLDDDFKLEYSPRKDILDNVQEDVEETESKLHVNLLKDSDEKEQYSKDAQSVSGISTESKTTFNLSKVSDDKEHHTVEVHSSPRRSGDGQRQSFGQLKVSEAIEHLPKETQQSPTRYSDEQNQSHRIPTESKLKFNLPKISDRKDTNKADSSPQRPVEPQKLSATRSPPKSLTVPKLFTLENSTKPLKSPKPEVPPKPKSPLLLKSPTTLSDGSPRKDSPRRESPRKDSPRKDSPGKDSPRKDSSVKDSPGKASPRKDSPRKDSPRKDSPRKDIPRKDSPRKDSSRNDSPRKDSPRKDSPRKEIDPGERNQKMSFKKDEQNKNPKEDSPKRVSWKDLETHDKDENTPRRDTNIMENKELVRGMHDPSNEMLNIDHKRPVQTRQVSLEKPTSSPKRTTFASPTYDLVNKSSSDDNKTRDISVKGSQDNSSRSKSEMQISSTEKLSPNVSKSPDLPNSNATNSIATDPVELKCQSKSLDKPKIATKPLSHTAKQTDIHNGEKINTNPKQDRSESLNTDSEYKPSKLLQFCLEPISTIKSPTQCERDILSSNDKTDNDEKLLKHEKLDSKRKVETPMKFGLKTKGSQQAGTSSKINQNEVPDKGESIDSIKVSRDLEYQHMPFGEHMQIQISKKTGRESSNNDCDHNTVDSSVEDSGIETVVDSVRSDTEFTDCTDDMELVSHRRTLRTFSLPGAQVFSASSSVSTTPCPTPPPRKNKLKKKPQILEKGASLSRDSSQDYSDSNSSVGTVREINTNGMGPHVTTIAIDTASDGGLYSSSAGTSQNSTADTGYDTSFTVPRLDLAQSDDEDSESWNKLDLLDDDDDVSCTFDDLDERKLMISEQQTVSESAVARQNSYLVSSNHALTTDYTDMLPTPRFNPDEFTGVPEPPGDESNSTIDTLLKTIPPPPPAAFELDITDNLDSNRDPSELYIKETSDPHELYIREQNEQHELFIREPNDPPRSHQNLRKADKRSKFLRAVQANKSILTLDGVMVEEDYEHVASGHEFKPPEKPSWLKPWPEARQRLRSASSSETESIVISEDHWERDQPKRELCK